MLYHLVSLKKALVDTYNTQEIESAISKFQYQIESIKRQVPSIEASNLAYINGLISHYDKVLGEISAPHEDFKRRITEIDAQIADTCKRLFANNYDLEEHDGGLEHVRNLRVIHLDPEINNLVKTRIRLYTNWQYPTLEIGCRDGEWTEQLVAADPLYVFDKYQEFLDSTNSKFNPEYQRRLRKYLNKGYDFSALPQGQFGFIFSWGHFNYVSLDTITQVLKSVRELLRPGGVFMFSYNDGDTPAGAGMAENFAQTFIPKSILIPICQSIGFEIIQTYSEVANVNWVEIRKPGELTSIKAHQVLGKIERRTY